MGCLGNLLWFIFGGAISALSWCVAGCLWCITVVGIPIGMQCFKFASLSCFPFGERSALRRRSSIPSCEHYMADRFRSASGD